MKKQLLALFIVALMAAQGTVCAENVVYYSQDFQVDSKPTELMYYDGDGNELIDDLVGTGLECGTWHLVKLNVGDSNKLIASASTFTTPGKADDWMVTPQIKIYGTGATLSWKSMSLSNIKKDGYKVYVSTKGYGMEDFETEPIFSIDAEQGGTWQEHKVSLDKYAGKTIYIAFVNDSYDKYVLCVDDIEVSGPQATDTQDRVVFQPTTPIMTDTGIAHMSVDIQNVKAATLDAVKVCFRTGTAERSEEYTEEFKGLALAQGQVASLTMAQDISVPVNTSFVYDMWIEVDGDPTLSVRDSIRGTYFISNRRTLIEEGTGTWCSNCPDGAVALDYLESNYPDNVVTIAVHGDNATDPMYYPEYIEFCQFPAYPTLLADRKYLSLPVAVDANYNYSFFAAGSGVEYFFLLAQRQYAAAELSGTATITDMANQTLEISVDSRFVNDMNVSGYDIALILLEDSVTAPDGSLYVQSNGRAATNYSYVGLKDTITGSGGWGKLPGSVRMKFNHVARAAYNGSFNGYGNSNGLPTTVQGGQTYTSKYTWSVPAGVVNHLENTSVVALMTDPTGYIVNSCKMHTTISPECIGEAPTANHTSIIGIYTPNGVQVDTLQKGINIIKHIDEKGNIYTRKVVK